MPVRSLSSSILKWPDKETVHEKAKEWAERTGLAYPNVLAIGYFGSYARGDWGVGSDLDVIIVLTDSGKPFEQRSAEWDLSGLPVPAEALVYTKTEWQMLLTKKDRFARTLSTELVWLFSRND